MKKTFAKYLLILSVGAIAAISCDKALDIEPAAELESNYFENENRVDRGIGAIYSEMGMLFCPNMQSGAFTAGPLAGMLLLPGDDLTVNNNSYSDFEAFAPLTPSNGKLNCIWNVMYATIARANFMLDKLTDEKILSVIKTEGKADWCRGEAYFFRGFCEFLLWDYFRKAPIQGTRIKKIEDALLEPTHHLELLDQAITDLKEAEKLLPVSWSGQDKGRVFKNSARGFLVKAYVYRADYADLPGGNAAADFAKAIAVFESMDPATTVDGVHYGDNFDYRTENNPESLYEYQARFNIKEDNSWLNSNFGGDAGAMGSCFIFFWNHTFSDYMFGGKYGPTSKLIAAYENGDPRKAESLFDTQTKVDGDPDWFGKKWGMFDNWQFIKYINGDRRGPVDKNWSTTAVNNPRILRFADVKLCAAEAYYQTDDEDSALKQVNDIRKRARLSTAEGAPASTVPADYTSINMDKIMKERFVELAGEGHRFSDMKRWHAAGYIDLAEWAEDPLANWGYDETKKDQSFSFIAAKHILFPIPQNELNTNPKMMNDGNNPGYN